MKNEGEIIDWLLQGDVSIQYQTWRDLLNEDRKDLQQRIATEGWGRQFLSKRKADGHWGDRFYQPKWTSTHYTLLDLRNLCIAPDHPLIKDTVDLVLQEQKGADGGILCNRVPGQKSDVCVNGMFLNYASYFQMDEERLKSVVDFLLSEKMTDGGFNCVSNRSSAVHSSLHSTISVLEGIAEYRLNGFSYRLKELKEAEQTAMEFILIHQLYISDRTGKVIRKDILRFPYPCRWKYDILRALDYFQHIKAPWDKRMQPAMDVLIKKRNKAGTWNVQAKHPGQLHFEMEKAGKPSRWNTLRALRVVKHFIS